MSWRRAVGIVVAGVAVAFVVLRPAQAPLLPKEHDIVFGLIGGFVIPMGKVDVVSWPSDCRTGGITKAPIEAALFSSYLGANDLDADAFDLAVFANRIQLGASGVSPRVLRAQTGAPVVSISRAGFTADDALICVEVFGREERAFFVLLARSGKRWRVAREIEAWRAPEQVGVAMPLAEHGLT